MEGVSGIYKITNVINGKFYIGSSLNIKNRWQGHRGLLNKGKSHNNHLQSSWNKYGKKSFICEIVEEMVFPESYSKELKSLYLESLEDFYIKLLKPEYNKRDEATRTVLVKKYKKVLQYDLEGNFVKEWESVEQVSKCLKIAETSIYQCCNFNMNRKSAKKFQWRWYEKEYLLKIDKYHSDLPEAILKKRSKKVKVLDSDKNLIEVLENKRICVEKYDIKISHLNTLIERRSMWKSKRIYFESF